jgi:hypothetical protein
LGDPDSCTGLRGLCALYIVRADAKTAHELSAQCVRLAQETQRPEFLVEACVMEGYAQGNFGDLTRAREALGQAVQTYRSTAAGRFAYPTPQSPLVASLSLLAVLTLIQGDRAAAAERVQDAIATAEAGASLRSGLCHTWARCSRARTEISRVPPNMPGGRWRSRSVTASTAGWPPVP